MTVIAVIPARYGSTRFPGKPLHEIAGVPMVERVRRLAAAVLQRRWFLIALHSSRLSWTVNLKPLGSFGLRLSKVFQMRLPDAPGLYSIFV